MKKWTKLKDYAVRTVTETFYVEVSIKQTEQVSLLMQFSSLVISVIAFMI